MYFDEGPKCLFQKGPKCPIGAEVVGAQNSEGRGALALEFSNILVFRYEGGAFNVIGHKNGDGRAVP